MTAAETIAMLDRVAADAEAYAAEARAAVRAIVAPGGKADRGAIDAEQHLVHGFGWVATYAEALRQVAAWARRLNEAGLFGAVENLLAELLAAEYSAQLAGGLPMTQVETIRPADFGVEAPRVRLRVDQAKRNALAAHLKDALGKPTLEATGLDHEFELIRDQFRRFADAKIVPHAHQWHLRDELIPLEIVEEMGALGVFGLTVPEDFGGSGLGKTAMCVVSEELSRAWIGTGSLGTRSEIAAELILIGGTDAQKAEWLPKIAAAEILPTAVFTEPNTGSDLGSLRTRAERRGDVYVVTGNKTWITHAARADVMTLLARTDPNTTGFNGLSMFLALKQRGHGAQHFPSAGMSGGEIPVIGYRGMKEYEISFDGFEIPAANLLGGVEGQGFRHLMATFESARIQTAARAVGVAQCALELGLRYALERQQFGQAIFAFPRVSNKLVMMAAELMAVRQLTYFSARQKDSGKRCDLEAGMAKLLAARAAWAGADNALQIHGGNGFAMEYPISRVLADARILNIFEGAGEIQAMVIARRLLEEGAN
jgi:(2S)-methylsuccinyl-CoA dehydrogenase